MDRVIKLLSLDLVKLDQENVRFGGDIASSQQEALKLLLEDPREARKLTVLAEHIAQNGLDPTELQLVFPDGTGSYITIEGNRRLAALKLLITPALSPIPKVRRDFTAIKKKAKYKIPKKLNFSVVKNREEGDLWVELKHTGENAGAGRVGWSSDIRDERRARASGVESAGRQLRKLIANNKSLFTSDCIEKSEKISITNLTRLFQSTPAQEFFQLVIKNKILTPIYELKYIAPSITYVIELMSQPDFTVDVIRHSSDRRKFIDQIPAKLNPVYIYQHSDVPQDIGIENQNSNQSAHPTKKTHGQNNSIKSESPDPSKFEGLDSHSNKKTTTIRSNPDRRKRKSLINWSMKINSPRINDIYLDLRNKLDVNETPASVSVVFRVFLEVSCDYYIQNKGSDDHAVLNDLQQMKYKNNKLSLAEKVAAVSQHLKDRDILTKDQANAITRRASHAKSLGSIDQLNQFVHGSTVMPLPAELNAIADEYKPLLHSIWA